MAAMRPPERAAVERCQMAAAAVVHFGGPCGGALGSALAGAWRASGSALEVFEFFVPADLGAWAPAGEAVALARGMPRVGALGRLCVRAWTAASGCMGDDCKEDGAARSVTSSRCADTIARNAQAALRRFLAHGPTDADISVVALVLCRLGSERRQPIVVAGHLRGSYRLGRRCDHCAMAHTCAERWATVTTLRAFEPRWPRCSS